MRGANDSHNQCNYGTCPYCKRRTSLHYVSDKIAAVGFIAWLGLYGNLARGSLLPCASHKPRRGDRARKYQNNRAHADNKRDNIRHWPWFEAALEQKVLVMKGLERGTCKPDEQNRRGQPVETQYEPVHVPIKTALSDVR